MRNTSTAVLLDALYFHDEGIVDELVFRWASLRSENQTLRTQLKEATERGDSMRDIANASLRSYNEAVHDTSYGDKAHA